MHTGSIFMLGIPKSGGHDGPLAAPLPPRGPIGTACRLPALSGPPGTACRFLAPPAGSRHDLYYVCICVFMISAFI